MKVPVHAVLFDLDGTLRYHQPGALEAIYTLARDLGAPLDEDGLLAAMRWSHAYWASSATLEADIARFGDRTAAFWVNFTVRFLEALGCPPATARELAPAVRERFEREWQPEDHLMPGAVETLSTLRAHGLTVGVVTNRGEAVDDYLQGLGLGDLVDYTLAAGEIEVWKPHPDIFHHALAQIGVSAMQALYVGDNYYADVLGAQQAGLRAVLLDGQGLFPNAPCPVVRRLEDLVPLLERLA